MVGLNVSVDMLIILFKNANNKTIDTPQEG